LKLESYNGRDSVNYVMNWCE